jgi:hypothetical protein
VAQVKICTLSSRWSKSIDFTKIRVRILQYQSCVLVSCIT